MLFLPREISAQYNIDSLRLAYDYSDQIDERISTQILIGDAFYKEREYEQAILEYHRAIEIIPNDSLFLKAHTIEKLANTYKKNEDINEAKEAFKVSNDLYQKDKAAPEYVARNYSLIGRCYYDEAQYDSAMIYYLKAEETYEKNGVYNREYGILYHFIGSVFKRQGDYDRACEYYQKEIDYGIDHNYKDVEVEGRYLSGICIEGDSAQLANTLQCMTIYEELENERLVGLMCQLAASNYLALGQGDSALYYQNKCLDIRRKYKEVSHLAAILSDLAKTHYSLGNFKQAEDHLIEAEQVALETGIKKYIRLAEIYEIRYHISVDKKDFQSANEFLILHYAYQDSAMDSDHKNAIAEMEVKYDSEKKNAQLALLSKDKELAEKEQKLSLESEEKQKLISMIIAVACLLLLIGGVYTYFKYKQSKKQAQIISEQKFELMLQKEQVEAKNKDITDSMIYASKIQKAIITSEQYIQRLFNDYFIFYQPRDIVSGDFYWAYETTNGSKLMIVADCTGHGVPGAMMSMLGNSFLNEIVVEGGEQEPSAILEKMRVRVKNALPASESKDGMDMAICKIKGNTLTFAGANLPIYLIKNNQLVEIKGQKQPVGYTPAEEIQFTQSEHEINAGDVVYLFSDGYADQFGGSKGKKYKYKTLREKLLSIYVSPLNEQKQIIEREFKVWKGDLEQLDDICLIGIKC